MARTNPAADLYFAVIHQALTDCFFEAPAPDAGFDPAQRTAWNQAVEFLTAQPPSSWAQSRQDLCDAVGVCPTRLRAIVVSVLDGADVPEGAFDRGAGRRKPQSLDEARARWAARKAPQPTPRPEPSIESSVEPLRLPRIVTEPRLPTWERTSNPHERESENGTAYFDKDDFLRLRATTWAKRKERFRRSSLPKIDTRLGQVLLAVCAPAGCLPDDPLTKQAIFTLADRYELAPCRVGERYLLRFKRLLP